FGLMSIRSGSNIHFAVFQAALSGIYLDLDSQNATCDDPDSIYANIAEFSIQDGELFLYGGSDFLSGDAQQIIVDRSDYGQGVVRYANTSMILGPQWETVGWQITNDDLEFDGIGFQACPGEIEGAWRLWLAAFRNPNGNEGCLGLESLALTLNHPDACTYT
ncbi:cell wall protein PhiA, partial [Polyplosphaeria fusca]